MDSAKEIRGLKRVFGTIYFVQGANSLPANSLFFYLKDVLKLGEASGQIFGGMVSLAWFIKPLWGWISDKFPIFGYRRKSWLILMAFLAFFWWQGIAAAAYFTVTTLIL